MIDLKGDVDEALVQLPEGELRDELALAIEAYVDALAIWSHEDVAFTIDDEPGKSWAMKYPSIVADIEGFKFIGKAAAVPAIWVVAEEHVNRASELAGE